MAVGKLSLKDGVGKLLSWDDANVMKVWVGGLTGARLRNLTLDQIPKKKRQVPMEIRA